jgi:hypothetical protein
MGYLLFNVCEEYIFMHLESLPNQLHVAAFCMPLQEVKGDGLNVEENIAARCCSVLRIRQIPEIRDFHGHQVLAVGRIPWSAILYTSQMYREANAHRSHCWSILCR